MASKLPVNPDRDLLKQIEPEIYTIGSNEDWCRIYFRGGEFRTEWNELRFFGPTASRYDHHKADDNGNPEVQNRGIIYCATDISTCVAEVFQDARSVDPRNNSPSLAVFEFRKDLKLLDLTGTFSLKPGASGKLVTGPRPHSRNWSQSFYDAYPTIDGLYYRSSMTNGIAIALYERAFQNSTFDAELLVHGTLNDYHQLDALERVCDEIGYSLLV